MRMEAVLPVALNVYHDSCQTVSPKKIHLEFDIYNLLLLYFCIIYHFSLPLSVILYQEYSDVAINREIQRQQGAEPGTDEERGDSVSPGNLSPSSSFRSSRGSAFSLWQDIPDVRSSGQLDNFSNEERKLQEVTPHSESLFWFVFYQPANFAEKETINFILTCFLISGQVWVGDIRGLLHTQLVYCSWPFYDVSWAVWVSWDAGEAVALLQTAWCERSQWEVNKDEE